MRLFLPLALAAGLLVGCAHPPVYEVVAHPIPDAARHLSLEQIEALIVEAGHVRQWQIEPAGPGHLVARQIHPKYSAIVDIYFDQKTYRIAYQASTGFEEENGTIHPHYNFWIRNLEHDIENRLANAAPAS